MQELENLDENPEQTQEIDSVLEGGRKRRRRSTKKSRKPRRKSRVRKSRRPRRSRHGKKH